MMPMNAVCVFCGSSPGTDPAFADAARELGAGLARRGLGLVYGGASVGLMGMLADGAIAAGGTATGVITEALSGHEIAHPELSQLHVVTTMHERKALMSELSDAFIMAPGGFGTCEEFLESVTWAQLGLHRKRCGILNVAGFFDGLLTFIDHAVHHGFIRRSAVDALVVSADVNVLLDGVAAPAAPSPAASPRASADTAPS
jgi:uncharacterized protein (TIGR00730 family)